MRVTAGVVWLLAAVALQSVAEAQFSTSSRSTTSGVFGTRTVGQGITFGGGVLGSRTGSLGVGGTAAGQSQRLGTLGTTSGQIQANARFLRQNVQPGDFVGASAASAGGFVGRAQAGGGGGRFQPGITRSRGRTTQTRRTSTGRTTGRSQTQIVTQVRLGFAPTPAPVAAWQVSTRLKGFLERSPHLRFESPVEVAVEGTTLTLKGVVASEHDRVLAERLALLEPGVWAVKNELVVAEERPAAATGAAASSGPSQPAENPTQPASPPQESPRGPSQP